MSSSLLFCSGCLGGYEKSNKGIPYQNALSLSDQSASSSLEESNGLATNVLIKEEIVLIRQAADLSKQASEELAIQAVDFSRQVAVNLEQLQELANQAKAAFG